MNKFIKLGLVSASAMFLLSGCTETRKPKVPQFLTGIEKTKEWKDYNSFAKKNNQPILDFVATPILYKYKGEINNYDTFLSTDPRATIETKWSNVKPTDIFEFEFYTPDNRIFSYDYSRTTKSSITKWTIGRHIYIDNMPAKDIPGEWSVKVYTNDKYVLTKKFTIIQPTTYEKAQPTTIIGFAPYLNSEKSTWNHDKASAIYISQSIIRDNKNIGIVPIKKVLYNLGNPNINYEIFEKQVIEDLKDDKGTINTLVKKVPMDYLIVGQVESTFSNSSDNKFETFIIDVKERKIIKKLKNKVSLSRSNFNIATKQSTIGMHPLRVKIYKELYQSLKNDLNSLEK
jgi:hypothetical protein